MRFEKVRTPLNMNTGHSGLEVRILVLINLDAALCIRRTRYVTYTRI